jgi:XTP/dITP diphosphohydrolase
MDTVRGAEKAIAADRRGEDVPAELDVAAVGVITEEEWRAHWLPAVEALAVADEADEPEVPEPHSEDAADEQAEESEEPGVETDTVDVELSAEEPADKEEEPADDQSKTTEP